MFALLPLPPTDHQLQQRRLRDAYGEDDMAARHRPGTPAGPAPTPRSGPSSHGDDVDSSRRTPPECAVRRPGRLWFQDAVTASLRSEAIDVAPTPCGAGGHRDLLSRLSATMHVGPETIYTRAIPEWKEPYRCRCT